MLSLAIAYLRDRGLVTVLNILLLALAVATLVILLLFSSQVASRFERDSQGIDLVVGAKGSPLQLILSSVYHVDTATGNIPLDSLALLRNDPGVSRVVPIAIGDSFRGFRIVGTEPGFLSVHSAALAEGRMFKADGDAVLGADVARVTGAGLGQKFVGTHGMEGEGGHEHAATPFTVVGILAPTGTVTDRLILTSVETVWEVHGIEAHEHEHEHEKPTTGAKEHEHEHAHEKSEAGAVLDPRGELQPEITALLVTYRNAMAAIRLPGAINRQTALQAASPATETARLLTLFGSVLEGARLFAWLLALTGGLSIFVVLLSAARSREGDLALLQVMGATRLQVSSVVLLEGLMMAAAGAVLGVAAGHALIAVARASFPTLADIGLSPTLFHPGELGIVAAVLAIGVVAAMLPALKVFRTDLAQTLSRAS